MDADLIVARWQERLVAMADNRPYVYRDTPQYLIEEHRRRLTVFAGYAEDEVVAAEQRLGARFPAVFRAYLSQMGRSSGDLFCGSDLAGIDGFERFRADALALMAETDPALSLPQDAVVYLFHQGYSFDYLRADGGFDGPVLQYIEGWDGPSEGAPAFAALVDSQLHAMESLERSQREQGGYSVTVYPGGWTTHSFGERPLQQIPSGRRRWQFWRRRI